MDKKMGQDGTYSESLSEVIEIIISSMEKLEMDRFSFKVEPVINRGGPHPSKDVIRVYNPDDMSIARFERHRNGRITCRYRTDRGVSSISSNTMKRLADPSTIAYEEAVQTAMLKAYQGEMTSRLFP